MNYVKIQTKHNAQSEWQLCIMNYELCIIKMNILITGANGQLGNEMRIVAKNSNDRYVFTDVNQVEGQETVFLDIHVAELHYPVAHGRRCVCKAM